jgi:hypothetical protein
VDTITLKNDPKVSNLTTVECNSRLNVLTAGLGINANIIAYLFYDLVLFDIYGTICIINKTSLLIVQNFEANPIKTWCASLGDFSSI